MEVQVLSIGSRAKKHDSKNQQHGTTAWKMKSSDIINSVLDFHFLSVWGQELDKLGKIQR
jgi:hypothetical protein